jgi:hypothetical protein
VQRGPVLRLPTTDETVRGLIQKRLTLHREARHETGQAVTGRASTGGTIRGARVPSQDLSDREGFGARARRDRLMEKSTRSGRWRSSMASLGVAAPSWGMRRNPRALTVVTGGRHRRQKKASRAATQTPSFRPFEWLNDSPLPRFTAFLAKRPSSGRTDNSARPTLREARQAPVHPFGCFQGSSPVSLVGFGLQLRSRSVLPRQRNSSQSALRSRMRARLVGRSSRTQLIRC